MIKDSGNRRLFDSGAVRDISEGKGRMDLVPLVQFSNFLEYYYKNNTPKNAKNSNNYDSNNMNCDSMYNRAVAYIIKLIGDFIIYKDKDLLYEALLVFLNEIYYEPNPMTMLIELSQHYENGAKKYCERNWEKGIPVHSFIDSATRHFTKTIRGDDDENHKIAFVWNIFGCLWTLENKPELNDLPTYE